MCEMKKLQSEEERKRYKLLIDLGNEVFGRMQENILNFNSRNITFISIILPIISIVLTFVLYLLQEGWQPSNVDFFLLISFILFLVISLVINISIFHPTDYKYLNVFGKTTFDKLISNSEKELLPHFLYNLKEAYRYNLNKYETRMKWFTVALYAFVLANITLIILIIKNIIWR